MNVKQRNKITNVINKHVKCKDARKKQNKTKQKKKKQFLSMEARRKCYVSYVLFNLENIYYFPSCTGGPISLLHSFTPSLLHSFTPSLPVRHLETGEGELSV